LAAREGLQQDRIERVRAGGFPARKSPARAGLVPKQGLWGSTHAPRLPDQRGGIKTAAGGGAGLSAPTARGGTGTAARGLSHVYPKPTFAQSCGKCDRQLRIQNPQLVALSAMARCETCGNDYDKAFQVSMNGSTHTFDSFECAIHALAPTCENCGIRIVGHGLEKDGTFFCCEHCAEVVGVTGLRDRVGAAA
jgi:hypothetical protein